MSSGEESNILVGLISVGFSPLIAAQLAGTIITSPQKNTNLINELTKSEPDRRIVLGDISKDDTLDKISEGKKPITQPESGMINTLITAGFAVGLATAIVTALGNEDEVQRLEDADKRPVIFTTKRDSKVDDKICLPLEGSVYDINDPQRPRIPINTHPNCVLGDTEIITDKIICALRTYYSGPLVEITTSKGTKISVTPNHMFLTPQGFVAADFLREGDNIINSTYSKWKTSSLNPNNYRKPSTIKQVFDSLVESSRVDTMSVPPSPEYLHGDAVFSQGNINIIWTNSFLSHTSKPSLFKHILTKFLNRCNSCLSFFYCKRSLTFFLKSYLSTSDCFMSGTRQTSSFFSGRLRHTQIHSLTSSSGSNIIDLETFYKWSSTTLENLSKSLKRFSSVVQLDEISHINVKVHSGFVYDLQTESTLYSGNGIILSNCRCNYVDAVTGEDLGQI